MIPPTVLRGDARALPLPDACVDLIVSSPPYWALRSYQDGGKHYDGQLGSEPTPAEFVDALLDVTRECVRVLKPSGSLWVNLGDTYQRSPRPEPPRMIREDAAWLAGVIDSDGSVSIHLNRQPEGRAPSFVAWVRVGQMRSEVVHRAAEVTGCGRVYQDRRGVWNWGVSAQQARRVLSQVYPWLLIKRRQAAAAIEVARHVAERNSRGTYRSLTPDDVTYRQNLRDAVLSWNSGGDNPLTPPEPSIVRLPHSRTVAGLKSLLGLPWRYAIRCVDELGLILRQEVVWSKPNPLPESVTDRARRSHEQWFHFTLEPRYYAAMDAVREPHTGGTNRGRTDGQAPPGGKLTRQVQTGQRGGVVGGTDPDLFNPLGRLPGSVWSIASEPLYLPEHLGADHFAAFPSEWPKRIILGWSPTGICVECGEGRRPVTDRALEVQDRGAVNTRPSKYHKPPTHSSHHTDRSTVYGRSVVTIVGEECVCNEAIGTPLGVGREGGPPTGSRPYGEDPTQVTGRAGMDRERAEGSGVRWITRWEQRHEAEQCRTSPHREQMRAEAGSAFTHYLRTDRTGARPLPEELRIRWRERGWLTEVPPFVPPATRPAVVLDPFGGTGTTAMVARALGRHGVTVDRSWDYCRIAAWRTRDRDQLAKVLGIGKVVQQPPEQDGLFDLTP